MASYPISKRFLIRNTVFWAGLYGLFMLAQVLAHDKNNKDYNPYWQTTWTLLAAAAIFYANFALCNAFFVRRKWFYWRSLAGLTGIYIGLVQLILRHNEAEFHYSDAQTTAITLSLTMYFVILVLISAFYWSTLFAAQKMKENAAIQLDLQRLATEKLAAEKKFLQSQVNPHFLHNTLNFLYAKSLKGAPELSDGIMTLSNIMKYALQKNENESGFVMLSDEMAHLENVIHIHQLRFAGRLKIELSRTGDTQNAEILPFVLITLVENALKHGDLEDEHHPIRIHLHCNEKEQTIFFSVANRKRGGPKELTTGIGLDNVTRRLTGAYGPAGSLKIADDEFFFRAELSIPLYKNPNPHDPMPDRRR